MITFLSAILLVVSIYVYVALARQIKNREEAAAAQGARQFGTPEVAVALGLSTFFLLSLVRASGGAQVEIKTATLLSSIFFTLVLLAFLIAFLKLRGFSLTDLTGISRLSFGRALGTGIVLIALAFPLIVATDWIMQHFGGTESSRQEIVEMFSNSQSLTQRVLVIILAVAIAPIVEEFIFRFFLYGVIRRYGGRFVALALTALLFAAVHAHLPSFAPLLVLATCLTLAYEWSGSLLVPMTMHCLFNTFTMIALAFPQTLGS